MAFVEILENTRWIGRRYNAFGVALGKYGGYAFDEPADPDWCGYSESEH